MRDLLFLSHRIPYPPNKGDKIRAWHMLERLAQVFRIHLGCFIDDPTDHAHIPFLRAHCADLACFDLAPTRQRLLALLRLRPGKPMSTAYYQHRGLERWVAAKLAGGIDQAFVFCSAMAPYLMDASGVRRVLDMVDVDSEKWRAYGSGSNLPARLFWQREARTLGALERRAAGVFDHTLLVSQAEAECLRAMAPASANRIGWISNGVDLARFAPGLAMDRPFADGRPQVVFTGMMNYRPNIDAVLHFAADVLPRLRTTSPDVRFTVAGAEPSQEVRALAADPAISVTGRVADIRPFIAHADAVVAPLRISRGIQNKVLEAMAMGRPVVASPAAAEGIGCVPGRDLLVADGPAAMADSLAAVLAGKHPTLGPSARAAMEAGYAWADTLAGLPDLFAPALAAAA